MKLALADRAKVNEPFHWKFKSTNPVATRARTDTHDKKTSLFALAAAGLCCTLAQAETGKLLLTGGVSSIDGTAGGGLTPWAVIGTNATAGQIGASAYLTRAKTKDYALTG